jgi:flagellar FliL protein
MSTATATDVSVKPAKGKKKLIIILAAVLALVLLAGGGAAFVLLKKPAAAEQDADAEADEETAVADAGKAESTHDPKHAPTFVPLETFTVNLADRDAERYAQIGITLEIDDAKIADQIKLFMPAIRNNILLAIADRSAAELVDRNGKTELAQRVRRETSRALGYPVTEPVAEEAAVEGAPAPKKKKKTVEPELPVKAVHFSNFIIQ